MLQVFGSKVKVDAISKVAELELAEKEKMKDKVNKILKHGCNVFINRYLNQKSITFFRVNYAVFHMKCFSINAFKLVIMNFVHGKNIGRETFHTILKSVFCKLT